MSLEITSNNLFSRIKLPAQDLSTLSFCGSNRPAKVKEWAESLPATRMTHTSVMLYKALPELARLKSSPENRLEMLESVRPYVQQCIQGLAKAFLNQPLILPEGPLKTAIVAQALQKHMSNAYAITALELWHKLKKDKKELREKLNLTIHRAITGLGLQLFRSYQLYTPIPPQLWLELHALYQLAELFKLLDKPVTDPLLKQAPASSIQHAYLRVLLMACARPNQLRQIEVASVYNALESWAPLAALVSAGQQSRENLFVINMSADMAPMYKSRYRGSLNDDSRELDTRQLLTTLQKQQEHKDDGQQIVAIPHDITPALFDHLTGAWSILRQRNFDRRMAKGSLEVCVGLTNAHFHITGGIPFGSFLLKKGKSNLRHGDNPFNTESRFSSEPLSSQVDPWDEAFDAGSRTMEHIDLHSRNIERKVSAREKDQHNEKHPIYTIRILDTSPGGYCLNWHDEIPTQVRAGEIIGLREQGRHKWSIGVVRWVRQKRNVTQLGIQLLAPQATPYGASMIQKSGNNSEYMRVLMLPELKAANQPASLLTTVVPFQEYSKVKLRQQGEEQTIQLTRRLFSTGSISQYSFRQLEATRKSPEDGKPEDFASVWNNS